MFWLRNKKIIFLDALLTKGLPCTNKVNFNEGKYVSYHNQFTFYRNQTYQNTAKEIIFKQNCEIPRCFPDFPDVFKILLTETKQLCFFPDLEF